MKIDAVYTWVDGSDPKWNQKRIKKAVKEGSLPPEENSPARFRDNQELKYSLRSIYKYAPWINNIFIITDSQKPDWLNLSNPKIRIIDHRDIFPDDAELPTFNSCAIETQLHKIEYLSEHFIYFNDDMFLGKECDKVNFFDELGNPRIYVSEIFPIRKKKHLDINYRADTKRNTYHRQIVNTRKELLNKFNEPIHYNIRHGIIPLRKSVLFNLENFFRESVIKTYKNSFRAPEDIIFPYLFGFYMIMTKGGKPQYLSSIGKGEKLMNILSPLTSFYTFGFVNLDNFNVNEYFQVFAKKRPFVMCLNQTPNTPIENINIMKEFLEDYYPEKSIFEK